MNDEMKIFTGILKVKIEREMKRKENELSMNQFGGRKRTLAAKQALVLSETGKEMMKKKKKYIEIYYDVAKVYDSVLHSKLIEKLQKKRNPSRHRQNNPEDVGNDKDQIPC